MGPHLRLLRPFQMAGCNVVYHPDCINPLPPSWKEGDDWSCPMCWHEAANVLAGASAEGLAALERVLEGRGAARTDRTTTVRPGAVPHHPGPQDVTALYSEAVSRLH